MGEKTYWQLGFWVCPGCQRHGHLVYRTGPQGVWKNEVVEQEVFSKAEALRILYGYGMQGILPEGNVEACAVEIAASALPRERPAEVKALFDSFGESELRLERCRQGQPEMNELEVADADLIRIVHAHTLAQRRRGRGYLH